MIVGHGGDSVRHYEKESAYSADADYEQEKEPAEFCGGVCGSGRHCWWWFGSRMSVGGWVDVLVMRNRQACCDDWR